MKVLVDADGCPVVDITVRLCRLYALSCLLLCDTSHKLYHDNAQTIIVAKGADSVDYALVNRIASGDIVITQDYGLAAMCLAKSARVLHQDGWEYTSDNIDALLLVRHDSRKHRASGIRMHGQKKRTNEQNKKFAIALDQLLQTSVHG